MKANKLQEYLAIGLRNEQLCCEQLPYEDNKKLILVLSDRKERRSK